MKEFQATESAELSVQDFRTLWLEKEADPPAFARAQRSLQEKFKKRKQDTEESSEESSVLKTPDTGQSTPVTEKPIDDTLDELQQADEAERATLVATQTQTLVPQSQDEEEVDELAPSPVHDTQATLVNPQLEKEVETMEKEVEEWMQDSSIKEATEALGNCYQD